MLPARGTACILSQLCAIVITVCFAFYLFCTPNQSYTTLNHFFQEYVYIQNTNGYRYSHSQQRITTNYGTACILGGLCPIFIMVCSTFYFSALQVVVLHSLESLFTRVHLHLYFLFGLVPLAGRILRGLVKTASQRYSLHI